MNHLRLLLLWCVLALLAGAGPLAAADDLEPVRRLQSSGQWPEALRRIDTLLVAKPDDPQLRFFKGVLLSDSQRNAEALAVFERLTQDYPELPEPYNNIAALHAAAGDFDRAEAALEQALRANPSFAAAHENLGDVQLMLARRAYARALKLEPGSPSLANKLALVQQLGKLAAPSPAVSAASAPR